MEIFFCSVSGRILRASRKSAPEVAGFGDTEAEATARLIDREKEIALEIQALHLLVRSMLSPDQKNVPIN